MVTLTHLFTTLSLLTAATLSTATSDIHFNQNALARSAAQQALRANENLQKLSNRAIVLDNGKKFRSHRRKRQTQQQLEAQQLINEQNDKFHEQNAQWQQAAIAQLAQGKTPQTFDEFVAGEKSSSPTKSTSNKDNSSKKAAPVKAVESSDEDDDSQDGAQQASDDSDDEECSDTSHHSSSSSSTESPKAKATPSPAKETSAAPPAKTSSAPSKQHSKPAESSSSNSNSGGGIVGGLLSGVAKIFTGGQGTFYATGLNACGTTDSDSDYIAAISAELFDSFGSTDNPNNSPVCQKKVKASLNGKSVTVRITDRCQGCAYYDLDFSPSAFNQLSTPSVGRFNGLKWGFVE